MKESLPDIEPTNVVTDQVLKKAIICKLMSVSVHEFHICVEVYNSRKRIYTTSKEKILR